MFLPPFLFLFFTSFFPKHFETETADFFAFRKNDPALHHTTEINWIQPSENGKMEIRKMYWTNYPMPCYV